MFVYYVYSSPAVWSFTDGSKPLVTSDTTSTKLRFIDQLRGRASAAPTLGTAVPGTVYLRAPDAAVQERIGGNTSWGYGGTAYRINANEVRPADSEMLLVPIRTEKSGRYTLALNTLDAKTSDRLEVFVNGVRLGELAAAASKPEAQPAVSMGLATTLPQGISVVRVRAKIGSVWVRDLVVRAG